MVAQQPAATGEAPATDDRALLAFEPSAQPTLAQTAVAVRIETEIKAKIILARSIPRNEDRIFGALMRSCDRFTFAEKAAFQWDAGGSKVRGASVYFAREAARLWGNNDSGFDIIERIEPVMSPDGKSIETPGVVRLEGWCWDFETNKRVVCPAIFQMMKQRKIDGKATWIPTADEREIRQEINRQGAIALRNAILGVIPKDFVDEGLAHAAAAKAAGITADPDGFRKRVILGFLQINVSVEMIEQYLGHPLGQSSPAELSELRDVWNTIASGESVWADYVQEGVRVKPARRASDGPIDTSAMMLEVVGRMDEKRRAAWERAHKGDDSEGCTGPGCRICDWPAVKPHIFKPAAAGSPFCGRENCGMWPQWHARKDVPAEVVKEAAPAEQQPPPAAQKKPGGDEMFCDKSDGFNVHGPYVGLFCPKCTGGSK